MCEVIQFVLNLPPCMAVGRGFPFIVHWVWIFHTNNRRRWNVGLNGNLQVPTETNDARMWKGCINMMKAQDDCPVACEQGPLLSQNKTQNLHAVISVRLSLIKCCCTLEMQLCCHARMEMPRSPGGSNKTGRCEYRAQAWWKASLTSRRMCGGCGVVH